MQKSNSEVFPEGNTNVQQIDVEASKIAKKQKHAQAQKKLREKKKQLNVQTLLEKAKNALFPPNFDADAVLTLDEFRTLIEQEKIKLRETAKDKRKYMKKHPEKTQKIQSNMAEEKKVSSQPFGGKIPTPVQKLQEYISMYTEQLDSVDSYEDRLNLMRQWNRAEHLSLVHHFSQLNMVPGNFQDLLKALCEVINDDQSLEQQLRIFLCICSLYKKPVELPINPALYAHMLSYLVEQPSIKSEQATGFLKAAFCNGVSLVGTDIKSLREFDLKFSGLIDPFYTKLQTSLQLNQRPFLVLPQTCFFLSKPVINLLKAEIEPTAFLPIEYYHYFLSILAYTFSDEQTHAEQYLNIIKDHLKHWERIKNSNYNNFLNKFLLYLQEQDQRWYGKLDAVTKVIGNTLALATQKKVTDFTLELVDEIMADEAIISDLFQRVSALEQNTQNGHTIFLQKALEFNQFNKKAMHLIGTMSFDPEFDKYYQSIFKEWGLSTLNPQQLALCKLFEKEKFLIANPGLGMGKSTFIAFQSLHQACSTKGAVVVILNSDEILLFRDYSKVNFLVQQLQQKYSGFNFSVELIDASMQVKQRPQAQILFMQPSLFLQCEFACEFSVFNDECHRDLLNDDAAPLIQKLKLSTSLFATTGTSLTKEQLMFLQRKFNGIAVRFQDMYKHNCEHIVCNISATSATHINALLKLMKQECQKAPVIVILTAQLKQQLMEKTKTLGRSAIIPLFGDDISNVQASEIIQNDFNKQNTAGIWNCYLINEKQGTGTDFPSHPDIELNGGVRVIIAVEPTSYAELCQYQCRTARLNNKGKVFYVVNRTQTKFRGAAKDYLNSLMKQLKAQADLDTKKALREINQTLNEEDEFISEAESETDMQEVQLNDQESEEEKERYDPFADRAMCSFCFGEIYLNGPAHICPQKIVEQETKSADVKMATEEKEEKIGKKTAKRVTPKEDVVSQDKATPKYQNPVLQKLAEKPKTKKFEQSKQSDLGFQSSGKRTTRKMASEAEEHKNKRQRNGKAAHKETTNSIQKTHGTANHTRQSHTVATVTNPTTQYVRAPINMISQYFRERHAWQQNGQVGPKPAAPAFYVKRLYNKK